jgi:hypothetical protein
MGQDPVMCKAKLAVVGFKCMRLSPLMGDKSYERRRSKSILSLPDRASAMATSLRGRLRVIKGWEVEERQDRIGPKKTRKHRPVCSVVNIFSPPLSPTSSSRSRARSGAHNLKLRIYLPRKSGTVPLVTYAECRVTIGTGAGYMSQP